jgi:hypothetical protein
MAERVGLSQSISSALYFLRIRHRRGCRFAVRQCSFASVLGALRLAALLTKGCARHTFSSVWKVADAEASPS